LFLFAIGCQAAPPFVSPVSRFTGLAWNPVNDTNLIGYNVKVFTGTSWSNVAFVPIPQTNAPGVLTNYPGGIFSVTATAGGTNESDGSDQITNAVPIATPANAKRTP
jgi:hypothetical protein